MENGSTNQIDIVEFSVITFLRIINVISFLFYSHFFISTVREVYQSPHLLFDISKNQMNFVESENNPNKNKLPNDLHDILSEESRSNGLQIILEVLLSSCRLFLI